MDSVSATLLVKVLDGLQARSAATAQNVANAGSPGYRPLRVTFEDALTAAAARGPFAVRQVEPTFVWDPAGAAVRLDLELAEASATSHRYAALADLLNRGLQLRALATRGS